MAPLRGPCRNCRAPIIGDPGNTVTCTSCGARTTIPPKKARETTTTSAAAKTLSAATQAGTELASRPALPKTHPTGRQRFPMWSLPVYVLLSSVLGSHLAFREIWFQSAAADVVFVIGTVVVGWGAFELAGRRLWSASVLLALAGSWITYFTSYLLLTDDGSFLGSQDPMEKALFVTVWGILGLIFAVAAPPLAARRLSRAPIVSPTQEPATPTMSAYVPRQARGPGPRLK